jgi:hypothetical protein
MDLATKAQAYKKLLAEKAYRDNPPQSSVGPGNLLGFDHETNQKRVDDAFEAFADLHRHPETGKVDAGSMQATMDLINKHLKKGAY